MKNKYIISALRNVCFLCEKDNNYFIGNTNIKGFDTKKEAKEFLKNKLLKSELDKMIPLNWVIVNINEIIKEDNNDR